MIRLHHLFLCDLCDPCGTFPCRIVGHCTTGMLDVVDWLAHCTAGCQHTCTSPWHFLGATAKSSTGVRIIGPVGIGEVQMTTFFLQNKIFVKN